MWNPFKSKKKDQGTSNESGFLQRLAMKQLERMDPAQRQKLMQKMLTPKNIAKNKDKILQAMEEMKRSGTVSDDQLRLAKKRLGL